MKSVKLLSLAALGFVLAAGSVEACPRDGSAVAAINQTFMGNNLVDLDRTLGLQGPNCARKMVYNVTVDLRDMNDGPGRPGPGFPGRPGGPGRPDRERAILVINGQHYGLAQEIERGQRSYTFPVNRMLVSDIRSLQLQVIGRVHVGSVSVAMEADRLPPPPPPPGPGRPGPGPGRPGPGPINPGPGRPLPPRGETILLGDTGLVGLSTKTVTIDVGRQRGFFDGLKFRAKDDAFQIQSIEVIFGNREVVRLGGITLREGAEFYYDFDSDQGRRGRGDMDRMVERVIITGNQGILWGTKARLEVLGVR